MEDSISPVPGSCSYEPPDSLWGLVEKSTPPHEREELKRMLGEDLVEQSIELHEEVNLLLEIWRDYRDETEDLMTKSVPRLPEPPAARDRLKQEIKFFVESIREKSKEHGRDPHEALASTNVNILQYALDERCSSSGYGSRPSTARSSQGRETPMLTERSRTTMLSTLSDEVEAINDKLTYLKFDQVVAHLRETLESEVVQLRNDTEFLQKCLDDEVDFRSQSREGMREPSLAELSIERGKLEKELLKPESPIPVAIRDNNNKTSPVKSIPNSIGPQSISHSRPVPPPVTRNTSAGSRRSPLKASHDIQLSRKSEQNTTHDCHSRTESTSKINPKHLIPSKVLPQRSSSGKNRLENVNNRFKMPDTIQHVTIRSRPVNQQVPVGNSQNGDHVDFYDEKSSPESRESSARPSRPSSANRFRRMVQQCRDES